MPHKLSNYLNLVNYYIKLNIKIQLEYRGAFFTQALAMFLNDCLWVLFWTTFFTHLPVVKGYGSTDVLTLWAITAAGFGLTGTFCGNALHLPSLIARGQLDAWMLYPRALLPHIILGKMSATSLGDTLFGYSVYICLIHPDPAHLALFTLMTVAVAFLYLGFTIAVSSLGFLFGNAEAITLQIRGALFVFSTYPAELFKGPIKLLLFTLIPAGFVHGLPVEALRHFSLADALLTCAGAAAILATGSLIFYAGLRRYESGNLAEMRG